MVMQPPQSTSDTWSSLYTLCEVAAAKSAPSEVKNPSESVKSNTQVLTSSNNIKHTTVNDGNHSSDNPSKIVAERSVDESMVAAALLELSGSTAIDSVKNVNSSNQLRSIAIGINQAASCDMKPVDLKNNSGRTVPADHVGKQQVHLLLAQAKADDPVSRSMSGQLSNIPMIHCISVKNNDNGAKLIQLPKGFEYLLQTNAASTATTAIKPMINPKNRASTVVPSLTLVPGIISTSLTTPNFTNYNHNNSNNSISLDSNNNNNNNNINNGRDGKASPREVANSNHLLHLQPNVYHLFSPSSSANQQNNSASANFASTGLKKRGRKRSYEGTDGGNSSKNPIKEFRLRQQRREHEENILLNELEDKYRNSPEYSIKLEQLYDANSLNIHFPRIKTNLKRGKAKDDVERINRKKSCARRDSKNYRERAKMKRELIAKKIQLLESIFNNPDGSSRTHAAIQIIDPSSCINGSSNSSICSSSASASPSQVTSFLPIALSSASSSSSSPDLMSSSPCMSNLFLFKRPQ